MKVRIDPEVCAGFGICVGIAPEIFALHDDGYGAVLIAEVPPEYEELVRRAVDQCPSRAISLSDGVSP